MINLYITLIREKILHLFCKYRSSALKKLLQYCLYGVSQIESAKQIGTALADEHDRSFDAGNKFVYYIRLNDNAHTETAMNLMEKMTRSAAC